MRSSSLLRWRSASNYSLEARSSRSLLLSSSSGDGSGGSGSGWGGKFKSIRGRFDELGPLPSPLSGKTSAITGGCCGSSEFSSWLGGIGASSLSISGPGRPNRNSRSTGWSSWPEHSALSTNLSKKIEKQKTHVEMAQTISIIGTRTIF